MPQHVRKGDMVRVIAGNARRSKTVARVLKVLPREDKVVVEGVNVVKRHVRPTQQNPQGGVVEKEMPIHISNVQPVVDGDKPSRVRFQTKDDGSKVRIAVKNGEQIGEPLRKPRS